METTKIQVSDFEDKESAAGKKYTRFMTNQGWMSCFEEDISNELKKQCGNTVAVDIGTSKDGKFKNIRGYFPMETEGFDTKPVKEVVKTTNTTTKPDFEANKQSGVATRYAVDLCIAGKIELEDVGRRARELLRLMRELAQ